MPKEFSEWEADYSVLSLPGRDFRAAYDALRKVQVWADSTPPVQLTHEGWQVTARPVRPGDSAADSGEAPEPHWEMFVKPERYNPPYRYDGDFIGGWDGKTAPTPERMVQAVEDWLEGCE